MKIKVCGLREPENIAQVSSLGVDMIGLIFYPKSPRYVNDVPLSFISKESRVGVFVDEDYNRIMSIAGRYKLDYVQLHGSETPEFCGELRKTGLGVIKAISVSNSADLKVEERLLNNIDMLLFDTKCDSYGGSGESFDWKLLNTYKGDKPFMLSGGVSMENVEQVKNIEHPLLVGVDLNSCFEREPAMKDIEKIEKFIKRLRQ